MRRLVHANVPPRTLRHEIRVRVFAVLALVLLCAGTTSAQDPTQGAVDSDLRTRTNAGIRVEGEAPLPPSVVVEDGLTPDEAVAIALWNSPSFQATLSDLGLARADVVEAGLLRNPVFSLLFPIGPKQLEWALQFPFEVLWQRPRRVAVAQANAQAVGQRLVWDALTLVAQTRTAHADAIISDRRLQLAIENADVVQRLTQITEARLRAGDISELQARAARADAARVLAVRHAVEHDRDLSLITLAALLGMDAGGDRVRAVPGPAGNEPMCGTESERLQEALAARPDVRAAEIGIDVAAQRARWERSRVWTLMGILDGNGTGAEANVGPGLNLEIPIFSRNQGGIARADSEVERASRRYAAVRSQVVADVRSASARSRQAQQAVADWRDEIVPTLEIEQRQAESAYRAGEIPLYEVLDVGRRLVEGRMRQLDAEADARHAVIALERSVGRACR